jgi:ABC-2 type transport system ATP-binding protein
MLTGVIDPTNGTATIEEHDICTDPLSAREHLGIVPEESNVYLDMSLWHNVMFMAELHGVPRKRRHEDGARLLGLLGLADRRHEKAHTLSKGLRQRLMLCSALVSRPEILFLDEPTSGLDVHSTRIIRDIVRDMNTEGLTVFLTTHNMAEAEQMCDRVAIIDGGEIVAVDKPARLRDAMRSSHYLSVSFRGGAPSGGELARLPGVKRISSVDGGYRLYAEKPGDLVPMVADLAEERDLAIADIATCKPTLEDVFLNMTQSSEENPS